MVAGAFVFLYVSYFVLFFTNILLMFLVFLIFSYLGPMGPTGPLGPHGPAWSHMDPDGPSCAFMRPHVPHSTLFGVFGLPLERRKGPLTRHVMCILSM